MVHRFLNILLTKHSWERQVYDRTDAWVRSHMVWFFFPFQTMTNWSISCKYPHLPAFPNVRSHGRCDWIDFSQLEDRNAKGRSKDEDGTAAYTGEVHLRGKRRGGRGVGITEHDAIPGKPVKSNDSPQPPFQGSWAHTVKEHWKEIMALCQLTEWTQEVFRISVGSPE